MSGQPIAVVVLAGGRGRRIGGDKPEHRLGDRTLLQHAVAQAGAWSSIVAVAGPAAPQGTPRLDDAPGIDGPLAGLAAALDFGNIRGAGRTLTIACDTPFLPGDLAGRLGAALGESVGAAVPASGGRLHPACALWRSALGPALAAYAAAGGRSLTGLAEAVGFVTVTWPEGSDAFFNINTPEDLEAARSRLKHP